MVQGQSAYEASSHRPCGSNLSHEQTACIAGMQHVPHLMLIMSS